MVREQYVSYDVAKLLKEKGFDAECRAYYDKYERFIFIFSMCIKGSIKKGNTLCPTHQMALGWLRENYGIHLQAEEKAFAETNSDGSRVKMVYYRWCPTITLLHDTTIHEGLVPLNERMEIYAFSHEQAINEGLEWVLENLIKSH